LPIRNFLFSFLYLRILSTLFAAMSLLLFAPATNKRAADTKPRSTKRALPEGDAAYDLRRVLPFALGSPILQELHSDARSHFSRLVAPALFELAPFVGEMPRAGSSTRLAYSTAVVRRVKASNRLNALCVTPQGTVIAGNWSASLIHVLPRQGEPYKWMVRDGAYVHAPREIVCTRLDDGSDGIAVLCGNDTLCEFRLDGALVGDSGCRTHMVMGVDHVGRPLTLYQPPAQPAWVNSTMQMIEVGHEVYRHHRPGGYSYRVNQTHFTAGNNNGGWLTNGMRAVAASERRVFVRGAGAVWAYSHNAPDSDRFHWPELEYDDPVARIVPMMAAHSRAELRFAPDCNMVCDGDGNLLVPLMTPGEVAVLSPELEFVRTIKLVGAPGDTTPSALAIDANGHLYAVYGKNTIYEFY